MKEDKIFKTTLIMSGVFIALLIILILYSLFKGSYLSIKQNGFNFLTGKEWDPVSEKFGLLPFLVGTLLTSVLSLLISIPFALSIAIFSAIYLKKSFTGKILNYLTDLLSGIPSVIYGFWGLYFFVPIIRKLEISLGILPYGVGIITASLILSIMIIPYTSSIAREVINLVPSELIEAGYAMGATTYDVIKKIILPYAKSGIFAGILLSFGRAFGETMAVTMVIGNSNTLPKNIFSPANTMASIIANEFTEATKNSHLSSLIEVGLWLFLITFVINFIGQTIIKKFAPEGGK